MKKLLSLLLALALIFSLSACLAEAYPSTEYAAPSESESESSSAARDTEEPSAPEEPSEAAPSETDAPAVKEDGVYTTKEEVALYLHTYGHLPSNFMRKKDAQSLGWEGGSLEPYAPGMCIGGDRFGNYEGLLPEDRTYTECDIDTLGADSRGAKRIVFSNDGLIYYTDDHYASFTLLYGEEAP